MAHCAVVVRIVVHLTCIRLMAAMISVARHPLCFRKASQSSRECFTGWRCNSGAGCRGPQRDNVCARLTAPRTTDLPPAPWPLFRSSDRRATRHARELSTICDGPVDSNWSPVPRIRRSARSAGFRVLGSTDMRQRYPRSPRYAGRGSPTGITPATHRTTARISRGARQIRRTGAAAQYRNRRRLLNRVT